jgi:adenosylcobinamide kinase/adenosylcobinamide-phosphate guanylyltransferase
MARVILVTGGSRSGKSSYAQRIGEGLDGPRAFVATCPVLDDEMAERVRKHQLERQSSDWKTLEETVDLAGALRGARDSYKVVLVDCLSLWINNLMHEAQVEGEGLTEDDIAHRCRELLDACDELSGTVIFVTNEVGMGIVPDNPASRLFRDLAGRCNQAMAAGADKVTLVSCGLPLHLKKGDRS